MSFKIFANLVTALGQTTKTNDKLSLLRQYFTEVPDADKVWTIALFSGRRPRRLVSSTLMSEWCLELTGMPSWLFTECYSLVGDLSETIALLLTPIAPSNSPGLTSVSTSEQTLSDILHQFNQLQNASEADKKAFVLECWLAFDKESCFVFNKLMSANFRVGVSANLPIQALAQTYNLTAAEVAHRISGNWDPSVTAFDKLLLNPSLSSDSSKPYPFYLAYPLEADLHTLDQPSQWQVEWKWDGIRGQLIKRNNEAFLWSRGEELITEKFPEFTKLFEALPNGICLDGEIVALSTSFSTLSIPNPASFGKLQKRIGRKHISKKILTEIPGGFIAYDLMEFEGNDIRHRPLIERRSLLEKIFETIHDNAFFISPLVIFSEWEELADVRKGCRTKGAEGLMLKHKTSAYGTGRRRGDWWKWKIDPLTIDAVMIYAQKGSGRRSSLYTDYTFAIRDGDRLIPFTKAYSGLTDKEFAQVDAFIKKNSLEKFGPVRTVKPELVFEIGFEGIAASNRHKSGVALRFPRMLRWRTDKKPEEINTLEDLKVLLDTYGNKP